MKTKNLLLMAALAGAVFTGCSNDEETMEARQSALPEDGVIRIATQVNRLVATRATETTAYAGTTLGLYIRPTDPNASAASNGWEHTEANKYTYPNVLFTKAENETTWTQSDFTPMLWKGENVEYEYYAYAPATTKADENHQVAYDLSQQADRTEVVNDLLWTSDKGTASALVTEQKLNITFDHALCKVAVEIDLGDEFYQNNVTDNPIKDITINSTRISGSLNVLTGKLEADANATGTLTFAIADDGHTAGTATTHGTYTTPYIFYAPGSEQFTVTITTTNGRKFGYTHGESYDFVKGDQYLIKLKMGKDVLQLDGITVEEWKQGTAPDEGKLETE